MINYVYIFQICSISSHIDSQELNAGTSQEHTHTPDTTSEKYASTQQEEREQRLGHARFTAYQTSHRNTYSNTTL